MAETATTFTARYTTRCPVCGEQIEPGDTARWTDDEQVAHAGCRSDVDAVGRPAEICPGCTMAKAVNGSCGCEDD